MRIRCQRSRLPRGGYRAADQVCPSYRTRQLARTDLAEAPTGEVACEAAVDQRVHSRGLVGEQGIHHLRRNAVLACTGFDDQRRELLGTVRVAAQLGDADRAAVPFADDELLPVQTGRIEPCPPHHRGDDRLIIWPCPPHQLAGTAHVFQPPRPVAGRPPAGLGSELPDLVGALPGMFCRRGSDVVGVPCPAAQIGGVARLGLTALVSSSGGLFRTRCPPAEPSPARQSSFTVADLPLCTRDPAGCLPGPEVCLPR